MAAARSVVAASGGRDAKPSGPVKVTRPAKCAGADVKAALQVAGESLSEFDGRGITARAVGIIGRRHAG